MTPACWGSSSRCQSRLRDSDHSWPWANSQPNGYRVGLPHAGSWGEVLNTDDEKFGGSGVVNGTLRTEDVPWQGRDCSAVVTLPPLAVVWFAPEE